LSILDTISDLLHVGKHQRDCDNDADVCLCDVPLYELPYKQPDANIVMCLDIQDQEALSSAIEYARQVYEPRPGKRIEFLPRVFALINFRRLSPEQKWQVNKQLIPAGASIFPYPAGCESFNEAKDALKSQLIVAHRDYTAARKNLRRRNVEVPDSVLARSANKNF
jgi:hypothetical protein